MIYFDNAATTKPYLEAIEAFKEGTYDSFGNSESNHALGAASSLLLEKSRSNVLSLFKATSSFNFIFTSGASESNNMILKGLPIAYSNRGHIIITSEVEHPSVLHPLEEMESRYGYKVIRLPINERGVVDPASLKEAMNDDVVLVSIMGVNNELGSVNDIKALSEIVHHYPKAFFHSDMTQAVGKIELPYTLCDAISFSSHKFGGTKGSGGLLYKRSMKMLPLVAGGEQELSLRAGTVNVGGAMALSKALSISYERMEANASRIKEIYAYIYERLSKRDDIIMNSRSLEEGNTPFVMNFSLKKKKASVVVEALSNMGIYVSSVSACSSKEARFSYVVMALRHDKRLAENSIRLSFSGANTLNEAECFLSAFDKVMNEVMDQ